MADYRCDFDCCAVAVEMVVDYHCCYYFATVAVERVEECHYHVAAAVVAAAADYHSNFDLGFDSNTVIAAVGPPTIVPIAAVGRLQIGSFVLIDIFQRLPSAGLVVPTKPVERSLIHLWWEYCDYYSYSASAPVVVVVAVALAAVVPAENVPVPFVIS